MAHQLFGKRVVVCGRFAAHTTPEVKSLLQTNGMQVVSRVTRTTALLVAGRGGDAARARAHSLGIRVVEEADIEALLAQLSSDPFASRPAKERGSSWIHMVWEGAESVRSRDWPQHLEWDAVLDFYLDPGPLQNARARGWSPMWFNPYQRIPGCARTVSGVIVVLEGSAGIEDLAARFAAYDGVVWRLPGEQDVFEVVLPLTRPEEVATLQAGGCLPDALLPPPGWTLVSDPTDVCRWHPLPQPHDDYAAARLRGARIALTAPPPMRAPTRPPAPLPPALEAAVAGTVFEESSGDIAALLRPALRLVEQKRPAQNPEVGGSRFGGLPDLPPDVEWPTFQGVPMGFLCQLNLTHLCAQMGPSLLPDRGMLWVFYNRRFALSDDCFTDDEVEGMTDHEAAAHRTSRSAVIHRDVAASALSRQAAPEDPAAEEDYLPLVYMPAREVDFEWVDTLPACQSPFVPAEMGDAGFYDVVEDYGASIDAWKACWLLGHIPAGDWLGACGADDQLLLKLSSHNRTGFGWGDMDTLYFVLPTSDLAACRFDRVRVNCGLG